MYRDIALVTGYEGRRFTNTLFLTLCFYVCFSQRLRLMAHKENRINIIDNDTLTIPLCKHKHTHIQIFFSFSTATVNLAKTIILTHM